MCPTDIIHLKNFPVLVLDHIVGIWDCLARYEAHVIDTKWLTASMISHYQCQIL